MNEELNNDVIETTTQETAPASGNNSIGILLVKTVAIPVLAAATYAGAFVGAWHWITTADERKERREARKAERQAKKALKKAKKAPKPHIDEEVCVETDPVTE